MHNLFISFRRSDNPVFKFISENKQHKWTEQKWEFRMHSNIWIKWINSTCLIFSWLEFYNTIYASYAFHTQLYMNKNKQKTTWPKEIYQTKTI